MYSTDSRTPGVALLSTPAAATPLCYRRAPIPGPPSAPLVARLVGGYLSLLPLFWLLGIDQFLLPVLAALVLARRLLQGTPVRIVGPVVFLSAFLFAVAISGFGVDESFRYITYFRNAIVYASAATIVVFIASDIRTLDAAQPLLRGLAILLAVSSAVGIGAFLLDLSGPAIWRTPIASIAPESIMATDMGTRSFVKRLGNPSWFLGRTYTRINSFFLYPTMFAAFLVVALPSVAAYRPRSRVARALKVLGLILGTACLLLTTVRTGFLALVLALFFVRFVVMRVGLLRWVSAVLLGVVLVLGVLFSFQFGEATQTTMQGALMARGEGSLVHRSAVYDNTINGILERPFLGWGTQRDDPSSPYPLGSHSTYLGSAYQQGLLGALALVLFYIGALYSALRIPRRHLERGVHWIAVGAVGFVLHSTSEVMELDANTLLVGWVALALLLGFASSARRRHGFVPAPNAGDGIRRSHC
jgi:O-antigen ligase